MQPALGVSPDRPAAWTVREGWWTADDGTSLEGIEWRTGRRVTASGWLRDTLLDPERLDQLRPVLSEIAADALDLANALISKETRPLTRAELLRGAGFGVLFVELTARCNERCTHCYADAAPERDEELPVPLVREAIDDAAALGFETVQFTGGDPLLHRGLTDLVAYARTAGIPRIELFTNGLALDEGLLARLVPHQVSLAFSVYSHDASAHDAVTRVAGSHARTLRAIRRALAHGLPVRVGMTRMPATEDHGDATRALLLGLGVREDAIRIGSSRSVGRGSAYDVDATSSHDGPRTGADGKACITAHGDVVPCIFQRTRPLGSLRERRLRDILEAEEPIVAPLAFAARTAAARGRLACGECRLRDALLDAGSPGSLVRLGRTPS